MGKKKKLEHDSIQSEGRRHAIVTRSKTSYAYYSTANTIVTPFSPIEKCGQTPPLPSPTYPPYPLNEEISKINFSTRGKVSRAFAHARHRTPHARSPHRRARCVRCSVLMRPRQEKKIEPLQAEHPSCVHPEAIGSPYLAKRMRYYENFVLPVLKTGVKAAERIA